MDMFYLEIQTNWKYNNWINARAVTFHFLLVGNGNEWFVKRLCSISIWQKEEEEEKMDVLSATALLCCHNSIECCVYEIYTNQSGNHRYMVFAPAFEIGDSGEIYQFQFRTFKKNKMKMKKNKSTTDFYPSVFFFFSFSFLDVAVNHYLIPTQCWSFISHSTLIWVGPLKKAINHICGVSFEQRQIQFYFSIRFDFITNISCA